MTALMDTRPVFALEVRHVGNDSPRRARAWLCWVLESAGVPQDAIDTACLVVSELVTNSVLHSDSPRVVVSVEVLAAGLQIVVHDDQVGGDWQQPAGGGLDEHGRGLILIRALTAHLTIDRHQHGTTITAVIPAAAGQ